MIDFIKKFLGRITVFIIVGLLVIAFAFFGMSDVMAPAGNAVAVVGDSRITANEFNRQFEQVLDQRRSTDPEYNREQALADGLPAQVLRSIAGQRTIVEEARMLGLRASDEALAEFYRNQGFVSPITGEFDPNVLQQVLGRTGHSKRSLEAQIRRELSFDRLVQSLPSQLSSPRALSRILARFQSETRDVRYVIVPPAGPETIDDPDDVTLGAFYQTNGGRFAEPERRRFTYVHATPDDFMAQAQVNEEMLERAYEARSADFNRPERRSFIQLNAQSEELAADATQRLDDGQETLQTARALDLPAALIRN